MKRLSGMEEKMNRIHDLYEMILKENPSSGNYFYRRLDLSPYVDIYFGITKMHNPFFMFEYSEREADIVKSLTDCEGFSVEYSTKKDSPDIYRCRIISSDSLSTSIFNSLVDDICFCVNRDDANVIDIVKRVKLWIEFFRKVGKGILNTKEQVGLFGELVLICSLLEKGHFDVIKAWSGPSGKAKDFLINGSAIEVKTLLSDDKNEIRISNVSQLDNSGLDKLYLFVYLVFQDNLDGDSIPDLVDQIYMRLDAFPDLKQVFYEKLLLMGYSEYQADLYHDRFVTSSYRVFRVDDNFPCIIPSDLKNGIRSIKYTIDLSACDSFIESMEDICDLFKK